MEMTPNEVNISMEQFHKLSSNWTMWAHLPHDTNWSLDSYKKIHDFSDVENGVALCESIPEKMIKNCMLFLMKEDIKPTWEDPLNMNGGCFSYKIMNKNVQEIWIKMFYGLIGNTLSNDLEYLEDITGITISPKKNFCIIKIWMKSCEHQDPNKINVSNIKGLTNQGCIFKKHITQ